MRNILLAMCLVFLAGPNSSQAKKIKPFGAAKFIVGTVTAGGKNLKVGDALKLGDMISTGPRSIARLLLDEGVAMQLGPNSSIRLEHNKGEATTTDLLTGYVLSRLKKSGSPGDAIKYQVHTKSVSMGVRGTTFLAKQESDGRTFLCVCEGTVDAKWKNGFTSITAKHHDRPIWISENNLKADEAPMGAEHTDTDIAELDKLFQ